MSLRELVSPQWQDVRDIKAEQILCSRARLGKTPRLSVYYQPVCFFLNGSGAPRKRLKPRMKARFHEITLHLQDLSQLFRDSARIRVKLGHLT